MSADILTLKRSFAAAGGQEHVQVHNHWEYGEPSIRSLGFARNQNIPSPTKRRSISISPSPNMPTQANALMSATFPSFMSVFGSRDCDIQNDIHDDEIITNKSTGNGSHRPTLLTNTESSQGYQSLPTVYQHRKSVASTSSDSTDSSPTTTNSTFDSPSITDPSPSSSPESPTSTLPLSPFKAMMTSPSESSPDECALDSFTASSDISDQARGELAGSNPRNVKGLSLAMNGHPSARPATASGIEGSNTLFTPMSPMKGPLRTGRRKPTNLSIQTPGLEKTSFAIPSFDVPPTPSHRPLLQHFQSSPALPSLLSPVVAPLGGMQLSTPSLGRTHSRLSSQSSISNQSVSSRGLQDLKEEDDHYRPPKSQEKQERGYPNGPIQVYDCGVFLYLEPNEEEAANFDTVINVAKEIKNPFIGSQQSGPETIMSIWRNEADSAVVPEPQTAVSERSFKSAFEWPQAATGLSPITPKAQYSQAKRKDPEYIHVPWDHNSELIDDLLPLCRIIDSRIAIGKTVLIHCQLGVSRSASLVLAYGLYKGYKSDFHAMYGAVKERSQWISPNMSLIYQLMDFRSKVEKGHFSDVVREPPSEWFRTSEVRPPLDTMSAPVTPLECWKPSMKSTSTQTDEGVIIAAPAAKLMKALPPVPLFLKEEPPKVTLSKKDDTMDISSSADSTQTVFPISVASFSPPLKSTKRAAPRPLPLRERSTFSAQTWEIPPLAPQASINPNRLGLNVLQPTPQMDLAMRDVPETPSLFSPRQTEFVATPFGRTVAGDLALNDSQSRMPRESHFDISALPVGDPRSPHQRSKTGEIIRSIYEVL